VHRLVIALACLLAVMPEPALAQPRLFRRFLAPQQPTAPGRFRPGAGPRVAPRIRSHERRANPLTKGLKGFTVLGRVLASETGQWAVASTTLGAAEATYIAPTTTPLLAGIQRLGFVGGAGLTLSAARDMRAAKTASERLDAAGDLAWGVEGMLEFSPVFSGATGKLAPWVGTVGGLCQTGVGLRRMWQGWRQRDWGKFKLGMLDTASGGLWLAWDFFGLENPAVVCGFVGLMVGREVYANRKAICAWGKRTACTVGKGIKRGVRRMRARARLFRRRVRHFTTAGHSALGRMGRGLDGQGRSDPPPRRPEWVAGPSTPN